MKKIANKYIEFYENLNKPTKLLMCLALDIPSNLYRFYKSELKESAAGMVGAIGLMLFGWWITGIVDIATIAMRNSVYWGDIELDSYPINDYSQPEKRRLDYGYDKPIASSVEAGEDMDTVLPEPYDVPIDEYDNAVKRDDDLPKA